jgi:hypothetical protein
MADFLTRYAIYQEGPLWAFVFVLLKECKKSTLVLFIHDWSDPWMNLSPVVLQ